MIFSTKIQLITKVITVQPPQVARATAKKNSNELNIHPEKSNTKLNWFVRILTKCLTYKLIYKISISFVK